MAEMITIRGAREHNLRNVDLELPARPADRLHRALGLGEVVAGVRHHLRRGPAPLRRVAVGVRPPVPRADGQARRRLHRGPVAGDLDRPEVGVAQPALHGRHHHRDLRLPPPPLRRASASRTARTAARSSPARRRSRSSTACCSCPRAPASRCSRRSCAAARASTRGCSRSSPGQGFTRARVDGELVELSERSHRAKRLARYENHTIEVVVDRLVRRAGHRAPAHRLARDRAAPGRRRRRGRDRAQGGRADPSARR